MTIKALNETEIKELIEAIERKLKKVSNTKYARHLENFDIYITNDGNYILKSKKLPFIIEAYTNDPIFKVHLIDKNSQIHLGDLIYGQIRRKKKNTFPEEPRSILALSVLSKALEFAYNKNNNISPPEIDSFQDILFDVWMKEKFKNLSGKKLYKNVLEKLNTIQQTKVNKFIETKLRNEIVKKMIEDKILPKTGYILQKNKIIKPDEDGSFKKIYCCVNRKNFQDVDYLILKNKLDLIKKFKEYQEFNLPFSCS